VLQLEIPGGEFRPQRLWQHGVRFQAAERVQQRLGELAKRRRLLRIGVDVEPADPKGVILQWH
jgi:hypothetical protein